MEAVRGLLLNMAHDTQVVEFKEVNDEQVSYRIRCCGEEATDSWHTVSVHAADHDASLEAAKQRVQKTHDAKQAWRKKMGIA